MLRCAPPLLTDEDAEARARTHAHAQHTLRSECRVEHEIDESVEGVGVAEEHQASGAQQAVDLLWEAPATAAVRRYAWVGEDGGNGACARVCVSVCVRVQGAWPGRGGAAAELSSSMPTTKFRP